MLRSLAVLPAAVVLGARMQKEGVEHLHVHFATYPAYVAWVVGRLYGIPWSMTVHAHDIYLNQDLLREKMDSAAFMVTNSQYNIDFLRRFHPAYPDRKLQLVRTGIDLEGFRPQVKKEQGGVPEILAVGRLDPTKGYRYLVEVMAELRRRGLETTCHVVGHITEEPYIQREYRYIQDLIRKYHLEEKITFEEGIPYELLLRRYRDADLFLLPCVVDETGNSDGLPSVLVEALAQEKPVVSTRISGIPELIIPGETGWLNEPEDVQGLADSCEEIIRHPETAARIARQGYEHVHRHWDIVKTSRRMYKLLTEGV